MSLLKQFASMSSQQGLIEEAATTYAEAISIHVSLHRMAHLLTSFTSTLRC